MMLAITGCAVGDGTVPVTPVERLVQADGAYKAVDATVREGVQSGLIKGVVAIRVKAAMASARVALDAWHLNPNDVNAETKALLALQAVRAILQSLRPEAGVDTTHQLVFYQNCRGAVPCR